MRSPEEKVFGDILEADVQAIETAVGMGHRAWDMVDPRELIVAVLSHFREHRPNI